MSGSSLLHPVPMMGLVVKDRGANVKAAGEELVGEEDAGDAVHCAAHLTKSVVDAVVLNPKSKHYDVSMGRDVDLLMRVATYVRGSEDGRRVFKNNAPAAIAHLQPLKDNPTRWEGIDISISRALKVKKSWVAFCEDPDARTALLQDCNQEESDFPSDAFFRRLELYKTMLDPLRIFSKTCQKMHHALMPRLVFLIARVQDGFESRREASPSAALRAKFLSGVNEHLIPLVRGTTVATKAALLSPESVDISKYLTEEDIKENWREIKREALLLLSTTANVGMNVAAKQASKAQVAVARARLSAATAEGARPSWQAFWKAHESEVPLFMPIVRLYMSMPISSVKPETVFSYAGELVTKKTSSWSVASVESMVLVNDFTRQVDFDFDVVLEEMEKLVKEQNAQLEAKEERARERLERIRSLRNLLKEGEDEEGGDNADNFDVGGWYQEEEEEEEEGEGDGASASE